MTVSRHQPSRRGHIGLLIGSSIVVGALALIGAAVLRSGPSDQSDSATELFTVKRGSFDIILPATGELVAIKQIEIRNQLKNEAIITEIIEEGKWVKAGDMLLRFNDDQLRVQLNQIVDEVNLAETAVVSAAADLEIVNKERESEMAKANLAVYLAELALRAWEEGEFKSKTQRLATAVESAQKDYDRLRDYYENSAKLLEKEFISLDEYRNDEIAMIRARSALEQAITDRDIYEKYESKQDRAKKESDVNQAKAELERTEHRFEARVRSAQSAHDSKKYQLQSKRERQRLIEQEVGYCSIVAPSPGLVVYSTSMESGRWGGGEGPLHVGSQLWPNQTAIFLPDTSHMAAEVKISEALSGMIKPGQRAIVTSEAVPNLSFSGEVMSIGILASSGGWRDPNKREYTVRIALGRNDAGLKPCMRCKAEIQIETVHDVVHVPIQAVFRSGPIAYVYVPDGRGYSQRKVTTGRSSELYVEVTEGLQMGDLVLLRQPQPQEIVSKLPAAQPDKTEKEQPAAESATISSAEPTILTPES